MVEEDGKVEETKEVIEDTPVTTEVTPPTAEQQLATLQQEHEAIKTELEQTRKGLSTAQSTLTRKDLELKAQAGLATRIDGIEDAMQILAGMLSKGDMTPEDTQSYKQEFADLKKQREAATKQAEIQARQNEYANQAQAVFKEAQEIFKDNPEEIERIEDALDLGKLDRAKARIERAKSIKKPEKKETTAEIEERVRKETLIASGALDSVGGQSTGGGGLGIPTNSDAFKKWIVTIPQEEYEQKYAAEVNKMRRQDKLK